MADTIWASQCLCQCLRGKQFGRCSSAPCHMATLAPEHLFVREAAWSCSSAWHCLGHLACSPGCAKEAEGKEDASLPITIASVCKGSSPGVAAIPEHHLDTLALSLVFARLALDNIFFQSVSSVLDWSPARVLHKYFVFVSNSCQHFLHLKNIRGTLNWGLSMEK